MGPLPSTSKKSSTLRPLPREFVMFTEVTSWAGQYDVINTVCGNVRTCYSTKGEGVLNVVDVLSTLPVEHCMPTSSVITFEILPLQLVLYLFKRVGATG